jgi:predicted outer membrane protein
VRLPLSLLAAALLGAALALPVAASPRDEVPDRPAVVAVVDAPAPGTAVEARDYALREAASPAVQEFAGGEVIIVVGFVGCFFIFLFAVVLAD